MRPIDYGSEIAEFLQKTDPYLIYLKIQSANSYKYIFFNYVNNFPCPENYSKIYRKNICRLMTYLWGIEVVHSLISAQSKSIPHDAQLLNLKRRSRTYFAARVKRHLFCKKLFFLFSMFIIKLSNFVLDFWLFLNASRPLALLLLNNVTFTIFCCWRFAFVHTNSGVSMRISKTVRVG